MNPGGLPVLAYLVSQYPAVSHTFILREINCLRRQGWTIQTASVRPAAPGPTGFTEAERKENNATFCVKSRGFWGFLLDHLICSVRSPIPYAAGLITAMRMAGFDLRALLYHLLYFAEAVTTGEWMRRGKIQHLHVHFANAAATVALLQKRTHGVPYSMTVHGPDEFYDVTAYHVRRKIEGASFICCISQFCRSQLMKTSSSDQWEKMTVCPLGVDPDAFRPRTQEAATDGCCGILCVGRLTSAKGQAILLAAAAQLVKRGLRFHLDLVGDGPDRAALHKQAECLQLTSSITFHGAVNQVYVAKLLDRADLFVLPSFAEGVPVSLMEAMAMAIPCISTTVAGIPELINSGVNGLLVPPSDPFLLADAMEKLINNPGLRLDLGQAGRRKVISAYNLDVNTRRLAKVFERHLGAPQGAATEWRARFS